MATDLATTEPENGQLTVSDVTALSTTDARNHAVADALAPAYAKASQLVLTPEESKALAAPFPDNAFRLGAGGDPNLIYIEHAYLRERLNSVLGIGAAVPIRRREWTEHFRYTDKYRKEAEGVRVYVDLVLVVRGYLVAEAVGDGVYYPANAKTNFSDALESAKSNALRRCCKEFGVGLQAWMKGWGEGWKQRQANPQRQPEKAGEEQAASPAFLQARAFIGTCPVDKLDAVLDRIAMNEDGENVTHDEAEELRKLVADRRKSVTGQQPADEAQAIDWTKGKISEAYGRCENDEERLALAQRIESEAGEKFRAHNEQCYQAAKARGNKEVAA